MSRFPRSSLFYFALVVVLGLVIWFTWQSFQGGSSTTSWSFSQLMNQAAAGNVKSVDIKGTDGVVTEVNGTKHSVTLPDCSGSDCQFTTTLASDKQSDGTPVDVKFEPANSANYLLSVLVPNIILVVLIAAFMWWVLRQTQSGNNQAISFGRSRARMVAGDKPAITFADVAGVDEAKLRYIDGPRQDGRGHVRNERYAVGCRYVGKLHATNGFIGGVVNVSGTRGQFQCTLLGDGAIARSRFVGCHIDLRQALGFANRLLRPRSRVDVINRRFGGREIQGDG